MATFECIYLLNNTVDTPIQSDVSTIKYPCTGFCYMVINNKEKIVSKYLVGKQKDYYELIKSLIENACDRKKLNKNISEEGEYIDEITVKNDFTTITNKIYYKESCIVSDIDMDNFCYDLSEMLLTVPILGCMIVNRSSETILFIKIDNDTFLTIDSHQSKHGTVNYEDAIKYITRGGLSRGVIQTGIYNPYI